MTPNCLARVALIVAAIGAAACDLFTDPNRERIEIDATEVALYKGMVDTLHATVFDASGALVPSPVTWTTANDVVASIDQNGILYAGVPGQTSITATSGALSRSIPVTVNDETQAPSVDQFGASPNSADLSNGDVTVTFTLRARDAQSGVRALFVGALRPSEPAPLPSIYCLKLTPVTGSPADGTWGCSVVLNRYVEPGTWTMSATVFDRANNVTAASTSFVVTNASADDVPPALTALTYAKTTTNGLEVVGLLTIESADAKSGVEVHDVYGLQEDGVRDWSCGGGQARGTEVWTAVQSLRTSCSISLRSSSTPIIWKITSVRLRDIRGNLRTYSASELQQAGFITEIDIAR